MQADPASHAWTETEMRGIDQADDAAQCAPHGSVGMCDEFLKQIDEQFRRSRARGIGQCRAGRCLAAEQAQRAAVGRQCRHQRAQTLLSAEGAAQQGKEMLAGGETSLAAVGSMATGMMVEAMPRKLLDDLLEQGRLVAHDIGSAAVDNVGERRPRSRINVVHKYKHKSCRTAVGQARP
jgi:hypothetical protein